VVGPAAARALVHRCARRPISPCGATPPRNYHPSRGVSRPGAGHRTWMNRTAPCCTPSRASCIHRCAAPGARARSVCTHRRLAALRRWRCCLGRGPRALAVLLGARPRVLMRHGAAHLPAPGLAPARARTRPSHGLALAPACTIKDAASKMVLPVGQRQRAHHRS
jgi:hypothetical protein